MSRRIALLMGGWSNEREVSLTSGRACGRALEEEGFEVEAVDVGRDLACVLSALKPDLAFNALHGGFGEDGSVQGLLEVLGIPYTHSGVRASALAMNKPAAKQVFAGVGLRCPDGLVVDVAELRRGDPIPRPYVVKPVAEGSTVGVRIVRQGDNAAVLPADWRFGDRALVERFIPGRELSVAVLGDAALGVIEIRPHSGFYDYDAKYTEGLAQHLMPAPIHPEVYDEAMRMALEAHRALGCRGVSRADLRYDDMAGEPGELYLLEVNTQPGMTPLSLVPEIAQHRGIDFRRLVRWMVEDAACNR
ncbi:MAG: D-alanine--D-alanine ligase [Alphaproteobacteria bacterium]|nr:D-alanine--D-alanine ligase [Alphaproteobacteria bacterium]